MAINLNTRLVPIPGILHLAPTSPLGLLAPLVGTWEGHGFNQIFRPFSGSGSDNFLELNLTNETLEFTEIPGEIPNRGMVQGDISLFGITYLQQVADANVKDTSGHPAGIHIEPGIWLNIPSTTDPKEDATVARLANIPHGTSLVAQGTATVAPGPPVFPPVDITPFNILPPGQLVPSPAELVLAFKGETTLSTPSPFRSPPSDIVGITQAMVDDPNSVLRDALVGKVINSTTVIKISTSIVPDETPDAGGGISDIAFLDGTGGHPNAHVDRMSATFWISEFTDASGSGTLLQYSQFVLLIFNGLSWPHVSVASLTKRPTKNVIKDFKEFKEIEHKIGIKDHKPETKDLPDKQFEVPGHLGDPSDPGRAGPAAAAPAEGRHFIAPAQRPAVGEPPAPDEPAGNAQE